MDSMPTKLLECALPTVLLLTKPIKIARRWDVLHTVLMVYSEIIPTIMIKGVSTNVQLDGLLITQLGHASKCVQHTPLTTQITTVELVSVTVESNSISSPMMEIIVEPVLIHAQMAPMLTYTPDVALSIAFSFPPRICMSMQLKEIAF